MLGARNGHVRAADERYDEVIVDWVEKSCDEGRIDGVAGEVVDELARKLLVGYVEPGRQQKSFIDIDNSTLLPLL
jgi:hypothetical protein